MCVIYTNRREGFASCLFSPRPGIMWQDSCFIHLTDIKGLRCNSLAVYLHDCSTTEFLEIDNWLWLEHDECFCAAGTTKHFRIELGCDLNMLALFCFLHVLAFSQHLEIDN